MNSSTQYEQLDALILADLVKRSQSFAFIHSGKVRAECERLEKAGCGDSYRILDRRLQALRKKGRIQYDSKNGWSILKMRGAEGGGA